MRTLRFILGGLALLYVLPVATHAVWWMAQTQPRSWSDADWSSAGILPPASAKAGAIVHVLAGRTGRWKGVLAHHMWIVVKPENAASFTRYEVVGWGEPVRTNAYAADGRWYGDTPRIVLTLDGPRAAAAIPRIREAVQAYPYRRSGTYVVWPGPNSNTFVAFISSRVAELAPALLPTAIGKDFRTDGSRLGPSVSGSGVQASWRGLLGVSIGWVEGFELNLLGLVAGFDVRRPALKLPGWGRIGLPIG